MTRPAFLGAALCHLDIIPVVPGETKSDDLGKLSSVGCTRGLYAGVQDRLAKQPGTELPKRGFDPTTLYARAFEYTATGAANLS